MASERELMDEIARLKADNASLAAWQCIHTDGKTGLVNTEHGHQICAKDATIANLTAENECLSKLNAALMGDDEKTPRYTTLRLRHEIEETRSRDKVEIERLSARVERMKNAIENFTIAYGMGWDLQGVVDVARRELEEGK